MRSVCTVGGIVLAILAGGCGEVGVAALSALAEEVMPADEMQPDALDDMDGDAPDDDAGQSNPDDPIDQGDAGENGDPDAGEDPGNDVDPGGADDSADLSAEDLSNFTQFSFSRAPYMGFCPAQGEIYTASIFVNADGSHELNVAVLRAGGQGQCIDTSDVRCATATQLQARTLTAAEAAALTAAFSAVRVDDQADPVCGEVDVAPCLVNQFAWDSFFVTDFKCSTPRLHRDQAFAIISMLEQFTR